MNDFTKRSDQFDIRINIIDNVWLDTFIDSLPNYCNGGSVRYMHVSGVEIGDNPDYDSYGKAHIHIALILHNHTTKRAIVKKFIPDGQGFYVEPRDKTKPLSGWQSYHFKVKTKIDPTKLCLFQYGELPQYRPKRSISEMSESEERKKKKKFADWERKKLLMIQNEWDQLDMEFPGFIYSSMGQSMKREIMKQANDEYTKPLDGKLKNYIM